MGQSPSLSSLKHLHAKHLRNLSKVLPIAAADAAGLLPQPFLKRPLCFETIESLGMQKRRCRRTTVRTKKSSLQNDVMVFPAEGIVGVYGSLGKHPTWAGTVTWARLDWRGSLDPSFPSSSVFAASRHVCSHQQIASPQNGII